MAKEKKYRLGSVDGRIEYAMDFFTERGFTSQAAAGIVGNLLAESGINPKSKQYGGGPGRGIAQWSVGERWQTYLKFAKNRKLDPASLDAQLRFIVHEMPSQMGESAKTIKTMTDQIAVAKLFMDKYERPGKPNWDRRVSETNRALRAQTSKGTVVNDRGPIIKAEDRTVVPNTKTTIVTEALEFFQNLLPEIKLPANKNVVDEARGYFDALFKQKEEEKTKPKQEFSLLSKNSTPDNTPKLT